MTLNTYPPKGAQNASDPALTPDDALLDQLLDSTGPASAALTPPSRAATFSSNSDKKLHQWQGSEPQKQSWKEQVLERFSALVAQYGKIAIAVHFIIYFAVIALFFVALTLGFDVPGAENSTSLWLRLGAAYAAAKILQPIRIVATLSLTPIVARFLPQKNHEELNTSEAQPPTANP